MQAAILLAKFDIFPEEVNFRQTVAARYEKLLSKTPFLKTPQIPENYLSVWAQYSVLAENENQREIILEKLNKSGIPSAIYYPKPLHLQEAFSYLGYKKGDFPVSENVAQRIFSLPMHPYLKEDDQKKIAEVLQSAG